jgi:LysM repeat protein
MTKFKSIKCIFLTSALTIGISAITSLNIFAATLTTKTYTVKSGDSLSAIAQKHVESLSNLRKANNKWNDSISPGQFLNVSIISGFTIHQTTQKKGTSFKIYTVRSGDCLSVIARNHGESLNNLRKANNKWNDSIFPGQVLNVSKETIPTVNQSSHSVATIPTVNQLRHSVATTSIVNQPRHSVVTTSTVNQPRHSIVTTTSRSINYSSSDVNLLARLITAESGGTSYNDQVSVGAVVMNRVKSGLYPNSISAVINQHTNNGYQFTTVPNGSINRPAQVSAIKAAQAALSGNDPTNNALYFHSGNANNLIFQH